MDDKTLSILEYPKILERLAAYCAFSASQEKARQLRPTADVVEARRRQAITAEAVRLMVTHSDLSIGGARDVRGPVDLAQHGGTLSPGELLDVKYTLVAARTLTRTFERLAYQYPALTGIIAQLPPPMGLIDAITRAISERGEILDSASVKLTVVRREQRVIHDRLMTKLQKIVGDPRNGPYLQEAIITQRDGRYVVPLRAEFKGRIRSIVHDQSSSGATLFVEPLSIVEQNNQYRELLLAERDEERRILAELSQQVAVHGYEINHTVEVIADLDLALACGKYAEDLRAMEPRLEEFRPIGAQAANQHPGSVIRLYQARHPLLDPTTVVPIDVDLDSQTFVLVITGPNTGGKTVALKTVGLLALMAQSGLHIPAHSGSEISAFEKIFADIGDEQSIEQSLSTFSGHVTNIIRILENADPRSLVILDELGAGTDPQEGSALARAILTELAENSVTTLVTTHHPELKAFAHGTPGVVNASVEFDLETLRPTYRLTIGLPGRSNAVAIAERLGLPAEIIANARREIHPDDLRAEDLLDEIHHQRELTRQARAAADAARQEAEDLRNELMLRLERIEDERRRTLDEAREEAATHVQQVEDEVNQARRMLARARQPLEALKEIEEKVEILQEKVEKPVERQEPELGPAMQKMERERRRSLRLGDKVRVKSLGAQGVVTALTAEEAEVSMGMLRIRARLSDLELPSASGAAQPVSSVRTEAHSRSASVARSSEAGARTEAPPRSRNQSAEPPLGRTVMEVGRGAVASAEPDFGLPASPGMELDLRGKRADEALTDLDRFLDAAFLAGLPFIRIIHGKGTGKLREVVRQTLHSHPHVRSFEGGGDKEGGEGVTVAKLVGE
jgi:DNA mismatch repair protein MutS2